MRGWREFGLAASLSLGGCVYTAKVKGTQTFAQIGPSTEVVVVPMPLYDFDQWSEFFGGPLKDELSELTGPAVVWKLAESLERTQQAGTCDYQLLLDQRDAHTNGLNDLNETLLLIVSGVTLTLIPYHFRDPRVGSRWEVRRCYDGFVVAEGPLALNHTGTVWLFQNKLVYLYGDLDRVGEAIAYDQAQPEVIAMGEAWKSNPSKRSMAGAMVAEGDLDQGAVLSTDAFKLPYRNDGTLAPWGAALEMAGLGGDLAGKAAKEGAKQAASKVPMVGGLLSQAASKMVDDATSKALNAAVMNKLQSDQSYGTACELVSVMVKDYGARPDYAVAKGLLLRVYPELTDQWGPCEARAATVIATPVTVLAPPAPAPADVAAQLQQLADLFGQGLLTAEEFSNAKALLLGDPGE